MQLIKSLKVRAVHVSIALGFGTQVPGKPSVPPFFGAKKEWDFVLGVILLFEILLVMRMRMRRMMIDDDDSLDSDD